MLRTRNLLLALFLGAPALSQTIDWDTVPLIPTARDTQQELGTCICDLTRGACDPNCCCDRDCPSSTDLQSAFFNGPCLDAGPQASSRPYCSSFFFTANPRLGASGDWSPALVSDERGILCIMYDNEPTRGFYYENTETISNIATFDETYARAVDYSYSLGLFSSINSQNLLRSQYKYGDPIQISFGSSLRGALPLPAPVVSDDCMDVNPAKFLATDTRTCSRTYSNITTACASGSPLDWSYYLDGYLIISDASSSTTTTITPTVNRPSCIDTSTGVSSPCCIVLASTTIVPCTTAGSTSDFSTLLTWGSIALPKPTVSGGMCTQVVSELRYTFTYTLPVESDNVVTPARLNALEIDIVYAQLSPSTVLPNGPATIEQTFGEVYLPNDVATTSVTSTSGTPGYVIGDPILLGTLTTNGDKSAISVPQDLFTLTQPHPITGSCLTGSATDLAFRGSVTFGENTVTGCTLMYTRAELAQNCAAIGTSVLQIQLGAWADSAFSEDGVYVGMWGNSSVLNVKDWVQVLGLDVTTLASSATADPSGACVGLLTEIALEFIWTDFGSVSNPQPAIVGSRINFITGSFAPSCAIPDQCRTDTVPLPFFVRSTVTFVRAPGASVQEVWPPPPRLLPPLPADVFYPFKMSDGVRRTWNVLVVLGSVLFASCISHLTRI